MIRGILFDVDGVVFDSEQYIRQAYKDYYREAYGVEITEEDLQRYVGTGEETSIRGFAKQFGLKSEPDKDKEGIYRQYGKLIQGKLKPMPGAFEFISNARKAGLKMALATSADRAKLDYSLKETGLDAGLFDYIVCGDMVPATKPDGSVYSYAASALVLPNSQCLVIEDALTGHMAAKRAGSPSLGVTSSFGAEELVLSGADLVFENLSCFPEFSTVEQFNMLYESMHREFVFSTVTGKLIDRAGAALANAYAPYSSFRVGAAILTGAGKIYSGCNVENASFGATICAERGAAMAAIAAEGKTEFKALAVVSESEEPAPPCALCRQFLTEFAGSEMQVYLYSLTSGVLRHYNFGTVMPLVFELNKEGSPEA